MKVLVFGLILFILFFSNQALAAPLLHSPQPVNNSYTGGGSQVFSINATSGNLNSSTAKLYIISLNAYQQGENWDNYTLSCVNTASEWKCSNTISFAIAGSDTAELFYFEANDTDNTKGNNGTSNDPLRFTLDRNPPAVSFTSPTNNSYVKGNNTVSVNAVDVSSGVNASTVQFSTDGSAWTSMNETGGKFQSTWNTLAYSNNQNVTLYSRASDNVGTIGTVKINVTVDNDIPQIVAASLPGNLTGNVALQANVTDNYSGMASVKYTVGSLSGTLGCTGTNFNSSCSGVLNTANLQDGSYTLNFTVTDNAGNSNSSWINITTKNTQPLISIHEPSNNAFLKGAVLINATTKNTVGVTSVELSIDIAGSVTKKTMSCNPDFTSCNYSLDTIPFIDGGYTITAKAHNTFNTDISTSISVSIDNTKPAVSITQPTGKVKDNFDIKADIIESSLDQNKVMFNISSFSGALTCTLQTPTKFTCATSFNSKQLSDGNYILRISAQDKAGNIEYVSKEITVVNNAAAADQSATGAGGPAGNSGASNVTPAGNHEDKTKGFSFDSKYILAGVVVAAVIIIVAILALVVIHRTGKTIITNE